ncbi:hypothetical protein PG997_009124 [Apiospora hydei]|uniref:Uncharacterized protein n=1 Tax=Apiospora hydei TaxID=1337664 RepID=A0ABR1VT67_9PEZI
MLLRRVAKRSDGSVGCDYENGAVQDIEPDPDIAGIGFHYHGLAGRWPSYHLLRAIPRSLLATRTWSWGRNPGEFRANPFDVCLYRARDMIFHTVESVLVNSAKVAGQTKIMEKLSRGDYRPGPDTEAGLVKIITALSDLQLFTGLSLLICGFSIAQDGMLGYHWKIITRLAWFSTITHLAALSIWHRHPQKLTFKRMLRLILMSCLAIMLVAALMVTADSGFRDDYYAVCYMRVPRPHFNTANPDVIFSCILLSSNFVIQFSRPYSLTATSPFQSAKTWLLLVIRQLLSRFCLKLQRLSLRAALFGFMAILQPLVASMIYLEMVMHIITSTAFEIYWLVIACEWGTLRLLELRTKGPPGENDWSFGQIFPLAMFIAPVFIVIDNLGRSGPYQGSPASPATQNTPGGQRVSPSTLPMRRILYAEKLSPSLISVLGPLTPRPQDGNASTIGTQWGSRPPRIEPFFLGRYESWYCFGDLVWQLFLWILFATFFLVLVNLEQFAPIVKLLPDIPLFPTEQDPP